ncbi:hypothetical protein FB566_4707 [Stackebrandtia endophytica]|uniref:Protein RecA n=2 Tax=Stackebrandtia endophytica TaxID=1496996 RepID=A0A543B2S0_9ACTN|nr:hypothetical protein FB566_4707 [Stackebrandtia endophytica]
MSVSAIRLPSSVGSLRPASQLADASVGFPVADGLGDVLPWPRLRPGVVVGITSRVPAGMTSLVFSLLAGPSKAGSWCAVVGASRLSAEAASHAGVQLSRLALVPYLDGRSHQVTAALLEGIDVVAVNAQESIRPADAARLAAKARNRGSVLVPFGAAAARWPNADLMLTVSEASWYGLRSGRGVLKHCRLTVSATVRGREREVVLWPYGRPTAWQSVDERAGLAPVISLSERKDNRRGGRPGAGTGRAVS